MKIFEILSALLGLSALFSYLNFRYVKLPTTIGVMAIALVASLGLILIDSFGYPVAEPAKILLSSIDFNETVLHGMLAFLLFAGSLHINLNDLAKQKWIISWMATAGVLVSTLLVGVLMSLTLDLLGFKISFLYCLLFGALISPTDPIAVLGILKSAGVPKSLETKIAGESLFNDGIGVVVFLVLLDLLKSSPESIPHHVIELFLKEAGGGLLLGFTAGYLAYRMLKSVDNYQVEVLITLALVTGAYSLADRFHFSGPIAIVVAGLMIGNHGRMFAMSPKTTRHLDTFWELTDEILNAVLFLLIGLEVLILKVSGLYLLIVFAALPIVLVSRWISVGIPVLLFRLFMQFGPKTIRVLTWAGLRGGISVALVLSLPPGPAREVFLPATYGIVVFSIMVQGLTIRRLVKGLDETKAGLE